MSGSVYHPNPVLTPGDIPSGLTLDKPVALEDAAVTLYLAARCQADYDRWFATPYPEQDLIVALQAWTPLLVEFGCITSETSGWINKRHELRRLAQLLREEGIRIAAGFHRFGKREAA